MSGRPPPAIVASAGDGKSIMNIGTINVTGKRAVGVVFGDYYDRDSPSPPPPYTPEEPSTKK